jgi:ABC-type branched-subunit amino acid transport system substrate-binding protein
MHKFFLKIPLSFLAALLLSATALAEPTATAAGTIKIGALLTLSGGFASAGEDCRKGIEAGLDVANARNLLEILYADSKNDSMQTISEFRKLVQTDKAIGIYTHRSAMGMALNPVSLQSQIPLLGSVGHKEFGAANKYAFQIWPRSDDEGRILADEFIKRGHKRSALIYTEDEWTTSVSQGFRERFLKLGGVLAFDQSILPGETDLRSSLMQIKGKAPDAIYMNMLLPQIPTILRQAHEVGLNIPLYFNFYVTKKDVADAVGIGMLEGVRYIDIDSDLPVLKAKLGSSQDEPPPSLTITSYVATILFAQAAAHTPNIRTAAELYSALLREHEVQTPDRMYKIVDRYVQFPMTVKIIRAGKGYQETSKE